MKRVTFILKACHFCSFKDTLFVPYERKQMTTSEILKINMQAQQHVLLQVD